MKLVKRSDSVSKETNQLGVSRRAFMKNTSLAAGGAVVGAGLFAPGMMKKAQAKSVAPEAKTEVKRTICSHCSVGCGIYAEVQNGVWTGQEPAFDHPFNAGGHCAKGAALREHGHGERRLKYPMKLEGGKWKKLSWEQAIEEIGNKALELRKESGPDSVYFLGSAKHSNEQAYAFRKMASLWGTNNVDHQARICHSTTVAGVANTWGYGAMTNSFNDMHNCKSMLFIGSNPAEAHPVAMQHILIAKEKNNEGGKWKKLSWEQAIEEIGNKALELRKESGPDSVYFLGSAKHSNEQAYAFRKMASLWGTNNVDHQARICHSTTVAGVANTWGYGAMTNSFNDMHNCKSMLFIGSNPAEAHPVAMQHILIAKEKNNCKIVVADPRRTRTAAKSDHYVSLRPGSDVAFIWGLLWHVFANKWEDQEFIRQRVFGMDEIREEVAKWNPAEVGRVTGVSEEDVYHTAKLLSENRPGCIVWCMGGTQHTTGNNNTRAYCVLELALGNIGKSGGGANIFRGHDNVQGATDLGVLSDTLPGYYGLSEGSWRHWSKVWDIDFDWVKGRFDDNAYGGQKPMNSAGIPVSRWVDGVLEDKDKIRQRENIRAMFYWGHAVNSQTRGPEMKKAMQKLDMMVIVDPYPTVAAVMNDRTDGVYLLPATTQFETYGSVTASNRSLQWRDKVVDPLFESKPDHEIMYLLSKKLGFSDQLFKNIRVENNQPLIEDITREFNKGMWTIGYTGQSPERLKEHQQNWHTFHKTTLAAEGGPANGETYGLPWPCWGNPEMKHPGTHILYDTSKPVAEGGGNFRTRFGVSLVNSTKVCGRSAIQVKAQSV